MPPPPDMAYWLGQKYSILGKQAEGEYQRNVAEAYKAREEGGQVATNAAALRELHGAMAFKTRQEGLTEQAFRAPSDQELGSTYDQLRAKQLLPQAYPGGGAPSVTPPSMGGAQYAAPTTPSQQAAPTTPSPPTNPLAAPSSRQIMPAPITPYTYRPSVDPLLNPSRPLQGLPRSNLSNRPLDPNQPVLPIGPQRPVTIHRGINDPGTTYGVPIYQDNAYQAGTEDVMPLRKGSANVKAPPGKGGKGGKNGKNAKAGGPPKGLEAILPALLAASQAGQMGGGAVGPQAAPGDGGPPMMPGAAAPAAPPPGSPGFARGAASVMDRNAHSAPGYPFGAGYLFGATAVPGQGSGTVDKVPAMLAPHEAVLNKAAADMMGRGKIAALNARGAQQMGLRRGAR